MRRPIISSPYKIRKKLLCKKDLMTLYKKGEVYEAEGPLDNEYLVFYDAGGSLVFHVNVSGDVMANYKSALMNISLNEYFYDEVISLRKLKLDKIKKNEIT